MSNRGTSLLIRLESVVPKGLVEVFSGAAGEQFVSAIQEDLLDMVSTWCRVGREREVVVLLDHPNEAALHRAARRGLMVEAGFLQSAQLIGRVRKALSAHRVVAVLDQPSPDFALADVDRLIRKAHEGLAVAADLDGGWTAFALDTTVQGVIADEGEIGALVERARLKDVVIHALTPTGRIDSEEELKALGFRIEHKRARAPRTRRLLIEMGVLSP